MSVSALESVAYMVSGNAGLDSEYDFFKTVACIFIVSRTVLNQSHTTIKRVCSFSLKIQLITVSCVCRLSWNRMQANLFKDCHSNGTKW